MDGRMDGQTNALSWAYLHTPLLCPHQDTRCHHTHRRLPSPNLCCLCRRTYSYHSGRSLSQTGGLRLDLGKRQTKLVFFIDREDGWMCQQSLIDAWRNDSINWESCWFYSRAVCAHAESMRDSMFVCVCVCVAEWEWKKGSTTSVGAHYPLCVFAQLFALPFG